MSLQIKLKNSVVQDSTPSTSDLPAVGELALNANINSIGGFMRASDNTIVKIFGPGSVTTPTATTTVSGIAELATSAETTTGSATNRVVTPAGLNAVTVAERTTSNTNYVAKAGSTMTGVLTATAGSNSAPAINFGDSDSGIFGGTNTVSLAAGGTTRLTADTGVSVVGTLAVTGAITSTSDLTIADKIIHAGDTDTAIRFPAGNTVTVETSGSERLKVDSLGRVLIGTSTARSPANVAANLQVEGTNAATSSISITRNSANVNSANLIFNKSRGAAVGSDTVVQNNDFLGIISFAGNDGTDSNNAAAHIVALVDGTPGANDMPGRLEFKTTADGAASPTTRLTIDSTGEATFTGDLSVGGNSVFTGDVSFDGSTAGRDIVFDRSDNALEFADSAVASFGDSADLRIYHNGSDSVIQDQGTGSLLALSSTFHIKNAANNETLAKFIEDSSVELYHNNVKKFETTANGADFTVPSDGAVNIFGSGGTNGLRISGPQSASSAFLFFNTNHNNVSGGTDQYTIQCGGANHTLMFKHTDSTGNVVLELDDTEHVRIPQDNKALKIGASQDLHISHDGSTNIIDGRFHPIELRHQSEVHIKCVDDGAVELYYDAVKKLETTSTGTTLTGNATINGEIIVNDDVNINADNKKLNIGLGADLQLFHNGTNNIINDANSAKIKIQRGGSDVWEIKSTGLQGIDGQKLLLGNSDDFQVYHDGVNSLSFLDAQVGAVRFRTNVGSSARSNIILSTGVALYYDNSKKFETNSEGWKSEDSVKGIFGTGGDLQIFHSGSNSFLRKVAAGTGQLYIDSQGSGDLYLRAGDGGTSTAISVRCFSNGGVDLRYQGTSKFETNAEGVRINGYLEMLDNQRIQLGTGDDFQLFHDPSTNNKILNAGSLTIQKSDGENYIHCSSNAQVELYHNGAKKLETINTGANVTSAGDAVLQITTTGTASTHDARIELITQESTFTIQNDRSLGTDGALTISPGTEAGINIYKDAQVELYHNNVIKLSTTANGICFNSDTAAANALDDYEEGTWTATAQYGNTTNHNLTNVVCRYTKVGSLVHVSGRLTLSSHTGSTGELRIGGLPFAKGNPSGDGNSDGICVYVEAAKTNITNSISGLVLDGDTQFLVRRSGTTASGNDMATKTDSGTTLLIGGTYTLVA